MLDSRPHLISIGESIHKALVKIQNISGGNYRHVLFVINYQREVLGALTDGDIRRALIAGAKLEDDVDKIMFTNFKYISSEDNLIQTFRKLRSEDIYLVPRLDSERKLIKLYDLKKTKTVLPLRALIMAGGEGKRLMPLTEKKPKPMLSVGDKPIIEHNIDRLKKFGIEKIHISVNYLGYQIKKYFKDGADKGLQISYIDENKKLGTAGAASLIQDNDVATLLLMNSDLLTNFDIEKMYLEFMDKNADMAVATIPYSIKIPYAIMKVDSDEVKSFEEKPTYTYYSNAGIYLIKKEIVDIIPKNTFYDATDLMSEVIKRGLKLISFPIRNYWLDIGKLEDYERAQQDIKYIRL